MSNPRLSIIPAGAVTDRSLEPRDLQVLCLLGRHTDKDSGWCRRSQVKMAAELDCSRASVQRSLERLVAAGWVQKKRPPWSNAEGPPSNSYMYRVVLDRDDEPMQSNEEDDSTDDPSHAENAFESDQCPPMGTPPAQPEEHPGAQPCVGTGAHPYVGTKNVPLERPPIERERDARARDRKARFLVNFETRWPTAAADDRQRTAYAAEALTEAEEDPALAGIAPFLQNLKRHGRKNVPAGWRYLEEKRWTLLEQAKPGATAPSTYPPGSIEAKAVIVLHEIAHRMEALRKIWRRPDGSISFPNPMTPQLLALAQAPPEGDWIIVDRKQGGSWESLLAQFFEPGVVRTRMREGSRAPWPWAPSVDGKLYTTGPPETLMSEQDFADLK